MAIQHPPRFFSIGQLWNLARVTASLALSRLLGRPVTLATPVMLMVEPTTACQLHCPHCPTGRGELTRRGGNLTIANFRKLWDSIRPTPMLLQLWNQGEPLVNRETPQIVRHAAASGARVTLSTNVELLARGDLAEELVSAGLHELILSLDGATPESHASYRVGGRFDQVDQGIGRVVEARRSLKSRHPLLTWQFLLFRHNLHEVALAKTLAKRWGVDRILFKTAQLEAFEEGEGDRWLPEEPELRRYDLVNGSWVLRRAKRPFCKRIFASAVVQWDGSVVPCCFDKVGAFVVGNLLEQSFEEVWRGAKFQEFRQRILTGKRPPMCSNCTEGLSRLYARPKNRGKNPGGSFHLL